MSISLRRACAVFGTLLGLAATPAVGADQPANPGNPLRIVVQINEHDVGKWNSILANIRNIQRELGKGNVVFEVVAIGPGLDMLLADSLAANDIQDAMATGVQFIACENTMHARNIARTDLLDGIAYTPAGYVEIARRQQQGWSYLRP